MPSSLAWSRPSFSLCSLSISYAPYIRVTRTLSTTGVIVRPDLDPRPAGPCGLLSLLGCRRDLRLKEVLLDLELLFLPPRLRELLLAFLRPLLFAHRERVRLLLRGVPVAHIHAG